MTNIQTPEHGTEAQETAIPEQNEETQQQVEETTENPSEDVAEIEETQTEETTEQPSPEPVPAEPDYKQKFIDSAREAMLLNERNKVKDAQLEKLTKTDTPTDDAMRELYPDWDEYNEVTKRAFIKQEAQEMRQRRIEAELAELKAEKQLHSELDSVIESNPRLSGKEAEFKKFALNPKNKGISAEVLAKAFLFDVSEDEPAQPQVQKTEVLPQGNGGSREPIKPKKISLEEAAKIRETDYSKWLELVKTGQIEDDID